MVEARWKGRRKRRRKWMQTKDTGHKQSRLCRAGCVRSPLTSSGTGNDRSIIDPSVTDHVRWGKVAHDERVLLTLHCLHHLRGRKWGGEREQQHVGHM